VFAARLVQQSGVRAFLAAAHLCIAFNQPVAEPGQNGIIKAGIGQFQTQ